MTAATAQSLVSLTGMVWLLRTTPGDAIRLPPVVSVAVIGAGFLWLANVPVRAPEQFFVLALGIVVILLVTSMRAEWKPRIWTSALALWHPAMAMVVHGVAKSAPATAPGVVIAMLGAFVAAHCAMKADRGRAMWISWFVSAAATVWILVV